MIKLLFLGSGEFPIPIFFKLTKSNWIKVRGLITAPNKGKHDDNSLKDKAKKLNIPIFQPQNISKEAQEILAKTKPEIILVCNFGQILDKSILKYPKYGCLNIHCSLLPKLRGACPMEMAILNGLKKTGVTIQLMAEELDRGDILFQKEVKVAKEETAVSLSKKLQKITTDITEKVILDWIEGEIKPKKQDHSKATYCYRLDKSKEAAQIDWDNTAKEIERKIRAFNPEPLAWTVLNTQKGDKRLKIFEAKTGNDNLNLKHGNTTIEDGKLLVQTGSGVLILETVQLEGKKKMSTKQFLIGFKEKIIFE